MDITKIAVLGLIGAVLAVLLKDRSPVFSLMVSVITAVVIFIFLVPYINNVVFIINSAGEKINVNNKYIKILVKAVIISYIAMFSSQLCRDFNQSAIGDKIELGAKVSVMALSAPLITELINAIWNIF